MYFQESLELSLWTKLAFGTGHVHNDMCVSMWFSYSLVFFTKVLNFSDTQVQIMNFKWHMTLDKTNLSQGGALTAFGQYADGIATLVVGYLMGKSTGMKNWLCKSWGLHKSWHLVGTLLMAISHPFMFMECLIPQPTEDMRLVYYIVVIGKMNFLLIHFELL